MIFRARQFKFTFPRPALVMGVVNVTPDSFSDGGKFQDPAAAVAHGLELVVQGADLLDIGGESTRPGATPVSEAEELNRVLPVIAELVRRVNVPLSVDTVKPEVARAAVAAGASIINDIAANRSRPEMWRVVAETGAGYICMHMRGTPQTMHLDPQYDDVVAEVLEFFTDRRRRLAVAGVELEQVVWDVGIGFGKTPEHNLKLLAALGRFTKLERPLLLGISRKTFLGKLTGAALPDRLPAALAVTALAVAAGVQMFRTHDVAETVRAVRMAEAVQAQANPK
ncbi:MAG TPA: dihydropteroate synthase [Dongiaceae bacterium]|jgi:dihydropteroate synthase|nr:dihydropteroate synthase [Dongiaceae bacterium]